MYLSIWRGDTMERKFEDWMDPHVSAWMHLPDPYKEDEE
jgi:hypothetical protein